MSVSQNTDRPPCFGTMWDPKAPECKGGPDVGYVNPNTGGNMRAQCSFFSACGTKTQAERMANARTQQQQQQQVIPPQQLVRQDHRFQPSATHVVQHQPQQMARPPQQQTVQVYPGQMAIPVQHEQFHPGAYQPLPVNYAMPGYLTVPEQREDNEGILAFAGRSLLRSMLKGGAHGLAHLIDTTPLRRKPKTGE